ncbi:probable glycerol-3-phosphate acyltransferase 3 [Abrus precatorius]|uniref:Probable glycerol-3-phosphate acyltransferase 3 n=1 Tax=Abrus precatorius TaxID=3816 RepID=A0A8B8MG16_ABRPR|nr:probable glycerol-3-phosphate acyltransferase 3 [Abrus precatorius]
MAKLFRAFFFKSLFFFWYRFLFRQLRNLIRFHRNISNSFATTTQFKYQKFPSLVHRPDLNDHTLIFDVENALLKSSSVFPYFMLVAFEAGGLLRAIIFVLLYPFVCLAGEEMGLKIMVMTCFFGIKAESFRVGRSVLPKVFLEDVGSEIFEVLNKGGKKVGVSNLPQVMVESFLREYLDIDFVVGRELKIFCGYYVGLLDETKTKHALEQVQEGKGCSDMIGITRFNNIRDHEFFTHCKEVYAVSEADKRSWQKLARERYHKALIFHDGRLALRPTLMVSIAMLMWLPYGFILAVIRISLALSLPFNISTPLLILSGLRLTTSLPTSSDNHVKEKPNISHGNLYVCNHRTLLDPLYISFSLQKNLTAVTYSLSRMSEILAPIKTVRLTRNRDEDAKMMKELLMQGDLVVCPEGTTCREPYLLRFSPLFSEMCDEIAPVAIDSHVSMFHGTTAGGLKCLDPVFFLMNPSPVYKVQLLHHVSSHSHIDDHDYEKSRFEVANHVQTKIGNALGFECTKLTRKDKYLILAGNEGIVANKKCGKS